MPGGKKLGVFWGPEWGALSDAGNVWANPSLSGLRLEFAD